VCGVCGVVELGAPPGTSTVELMVRALAHRGPDGHGVFTDPSGAALGAARLAVLDPSERGNQPLSDGTLTIVHNGEIYNYRELRTDLERSGQRFRSGSDTEVVLAAFRAWGPACVDRFVGMWAFAIWDANKHELFCSRDRFGIKPFFYHLTGSTFTFASELKAFFAGALPAPRTNPALIREYLEVGRLDHTPETFFADVLRLPAAHNLYLRRGRIELRRYWSLGELPQPPADVEEAVRSAFFDSVRLHLRSDVQVGTCLSGGIDSSAITVAVKTLRARGEEVPIGRRQCTFTAFFDDPALDERPFAREVVAETGADPHWVTFGLEDLLESLPLVVAAQDEPFGSSSIVAQWFVMQAAREAGVKVLLDGQGGDELFGGYRGYLPYRFLDLLRSGRLRRLVAEARAQRRLSAANWAYLSLAPALALLPDRIECRLRAQAAGARSLVGRELPSHVVPFEPSPFQDAFRSRLFLVLTQLGLPELLRYEDRNSMAHSVEARVPFLDHRLVELAFSVDGDTLAAPGLPKPLLRRAVGDLLPRAVRERRDKLGFVTPERDWFRRGLAAYARDLFASPTADRGWLDLRAVQKQLADVEKGRREANSAVWRAVCLELWAQFAVEKRGASRIAP
jgi:asparagine synthase (glutamine-hydrolysing)